MHIYTYMCVFEVKKALYKHVHVHCICIHFNTIP